MEAYKLQIIESIVAIVILVFSVNMILLLADRVGKKLDYQKARVKVLKKAISLIVYLIFVNVLILIWGIESQQLAAYLASLFTVLGVAFLAQWSILSNITSSFIIFFNHQIKIGDYVTILDKDYQIEGKVSDIGIFFILIKTVEEEYVSLPSTVFMQKMVKKMKVD